jgi:hypothetical protein
MLSGKNSNRREDRPNQTDHLRLQVAVKRGTLFSGETKDDKVHQGSDAHGVFKGMMLGLSVGFFFLFSLFFDESYDVTIFKMGRKTKNQMDCKRKDIRGCATRILRPFITGRRDWHCHPRQRKVGVELKRCCNMKRGPCGQRVWNMMGDPNWVAGW